MVAIITGTVPRYTQGLHRPSTVASPPPPPQERVTVLPTPRGERSPMRGSMVGIDRLNVPTIDIFSH